VTGMSSTGLTVITVMPEGRDGNHGSAGLIFC
jgi:hypothetical protein